jgi:hypothetical protein
MKMNSRMHSFGWQFRLGLSALVLASFLAGCNEPPPARKPAASNLSAAQAQMNPEKASITATAATKRFENLKGDVPVVTLAFSGADTAEVWRCSTRFNLVYGNGLQKLAELPKSSPEYRSSAKDAFTRMRGELSSCRAIAKETTGNTVTDYGATNGSFYYVVNPCVSKAASITSAAACSFDLSITPPIEYKNTRTDYEIEVLGGLTDAEGRLYGNFNSMRRAAEEANASLTSCVLEEAGKRAAQAQLFGVIKIVSAVALAPLVNGLVAGAGSLLNEAVNKVLGMAAPQQIAQIECPAARVSMEFYNDLQGKTVQLATEVLEARKKLAELDGQYVSVEKELKILKTGQNK